MNLLVISYKTCWPEPSSPSGFATDGGFPFQMRALSELFDETRLLIPCAARERESGEGHLAGRRLSVIPLTSPTGAGLRRKAAFPFWLLRNLPRLLREVARADAVHTPIPGDIGTIGMLLAFAMRKPLFIRYCGNWTEQMTVAEHFWRWFMETFAGGRTVCLATGGAAHPPSAKNPAMGWIFATTLTEEELTRCRAAERRAPGDSPRLIIACRQDAEKGAGLVIESLAELRDEFPGISFSIVGDGVATAGFRQRVAELSLRDRVVFHGQVDHDRVIELLGEADLFCFPTRSSEGFPKAVLEAMACGLPVVTTRVSVLPLLVGNECGEVIEPATPETVAAAVRNCLRDPSRYLALSHAARSRAARYSLEEWRDTIGGLLRAAWGKLRSDG
ncbi:MAG: glycosyltransferase family 4 protein [Blastocatellia bacterium]|nr:glycosyltransferase family 4 protein [Blastocatellia bacterium]